jgi:hypothetical protein
MQKYFVIVGVSETVEVEADTLEEAEKLAIDVFDPTAHDPEIIDTWSIDDDD